MQGQWSWHWWFQSSIRDEIVPAIVEGLVEREELLSAHDHVALAETEAALAVWIHDYMDAVYCRSYLRIRSRIT